MIIDIYSRCVPAWLLADRESSTLAEQLLGDTCYRQNTDLGQLAIHADGGVLDGVQTGRTAARGPRGVTMSHSRLHVSNDNPFSEANSKTLKYRPDFPDRFGSIEHARAHVRGFFGWYNHQHRLHGGIGLMAPANVHYGRGEQIAAARSRVFDAAYATNLERFVRKPPLPRSLALAVWINRPDTDAYKEQPAQ